MKNFNKRIVHRVRSLLMTHQTLLGVSLAGSTELDEFPPITNH